MPSIRSLLAADEPHVLAINGRARPNVAALDHLEFKRLMALSSAHIVAASGDTLLGYALSFERNDAYDGEEFLALRALISEPFVYIDQIAVADSARGTGIGRALYAALEHSARQRGALCMCCEVNTAPPNPGSLAFHRRVGFRELSSFATHDGRNVVLLRKSIPVAA